MCILRISYRIVAQYVKTYEQPKFDEEGKLIMYFFYLFTEKKLNKFKQKEEKY